VCRESIGVNVLTIDTVPRRCPTRPRQPKRIVLVGNDNA
jgi:hypothetical protein